MQKTIKIGCVQLDLSILFNVSVRRVPWSRRRLWRVHPSYWTRAQKRLIAAEIDRRLQVVSEEQRVRLFRQWARLHGWTEQSSPKLGMREAAQWALEAWGCTQ